MVGMNVCSASLGTSFLIVFRKAVFEHLTSNELSKQLNTMKYEFIYIAFVGRTTFPLKVPYLQAPLDEKKVNA